MNNDVIAGKWKELKGKVTQKWGKITDNDITQMKGTFTELEGKLQTAYGYDKEQAKKEIHSFLKENNIKETDSI